MPATQRYQDMQRNASEDPAAAYQTENLDTVEASRKGDVPQVTTRPRDSGVQAVRGLLEGECHHECHSHGAVVQPNWLRVRDCHQPRWRRSEPEGCTNPGSCRGLVIFVQQTA
jgi:hypothetical protein